MTKTIDDIRRQIDSIDDRIHDLLRERFAIVERITAEKRKTGAPIVQPAREIALVRRLLARHDGDFPAESVVRIWREMFGAVAALDKGLKVAVTAPDNGAGVLSWGLARDYFSTAVPMVRAANALAVLTMVREGEAAFGIVPWPHDHDANPWWRFLMGEGGGDKPIRIVARLPLCGDGGNDPGPESRMLAVARLPFASSGDDRSFLALNLEHSVSRARIVDKAKELGLEPLSLYTSHAKDGGRSTHLLEVEGYAGTEDERPGVLFSRLSESGDGKCLSLGGYPAPP